MTHKQYLQAFYQGYKAGLLKYSYRYTHGHVSYLALGQAGLVKVADALREAEEEERKAIEKLAEKAEEQV